MSVETHLVTRNRRIGVAWALPVAAALCYSCGGGGQTAPAQQTSLQVGEASIQFSGKATTQITANSTGVSVAAMAGANFTSLQMNPAPRLADTYMLYENYDPNLGVTMIQRTANSYGGILPEVFRAPGGGQIYSPTFVSDGRLVFGLYVPGASYAQAYVCNADGTGLQQVTNNGYDTYNPVISPNRTQIAFNDDNSRLYVAPLNANGTAGTPKMLQLPYNNQGWTPSWSPDSKNLAYEIGQLILKVPAAGGTSVQVANIAGNYPAWSPDGKWIAFSTGVSGLSNIEIVDANDPGSIEQLPSVNNTDIQPVWSPDGKQLAFMRGDAAGDQTGYKMCVTTFDGTSVRDVVLPSAATPELVDPAWSPFLPVKTFIGTGLVPTASGFLYSQLGDSFAAFASFTAKTPSTATETVQSATQPGGAIVYDLHADQLLTFEYRNGYLLNPTIVNVSGSDMLVSVSGLTGQISAVATYSATPWGGVRRVAGSTFGPFSAVWDGGKRLGAGSITLDAVSGEVRMIR